MQNHLKIENKLIAKNYAQDDFKVIHWRGDYKVSL